MAHFDRFDIVEAHYLYCVHWHGGGGSPEYARQCHITHALGFKPAYNLELGTLSENGREIYNLLVARSQFPLLVGEIQAALYGMMDLGHDPLVEYSGGVQARLECGCGSVVYVPCDPEVG